MYHAFISAKHLPMLRRTQTKGIRGDIACIHVHSLSNCAMFKNGKDSIISSKLNSIILKQVKAESMFSIFSATGYGSKRSAAN